MANVFDVINKMYSGYESQWNKLTDYEKQSGYFLLNRCMNMIQPVISAELSRNKISELGVMEYWQTILSRQYSSTPKCFYQVNPRKKKQQAEVKKKKYIPSKETVAYYKKTYNLDEESYKELELRYGDELLEELKAIQKARE